MSKYTAKAALFSGIIDYAGTFPPAALPLKDALKFNTEYRKNAKHPWLWSKMALNLSDLKNLDAKTLFENGFDGNPLVVAILGTPFTGTSATEYIKHIEWDLREVEHCKKRSFQSSARQLFLSYETKLPEGIELKSILDPVLTRFAELSELEPFFEVSFGKDFEKNLKEAVQLCAQWKEDNDEVEFTPGIKIRTGGKYRLKMSMSDQTMEFFGKYLEVTPNSRLVWTNEEGGADAAVVTTVTFEETEGATRVTVQDLYPSKKALDNAIATDSTGALPEQLEQLAQLIAAG